MEISEASLNYEGVTIPWEEVSSLKLMNRKLTLIHHKGQKIELLNLSLKEIDAIFRVFEKAHLKSAHKIR